MPVITVHLKPKHTFNPRGIKGPSLEDGQGVAHSFFVDAFDQVINLKINIFKAWGVPVEDQKLVYTRGDKQQVMYSSQDISNFDFTGAYHVALRFTTAMEKQFITAQAKKLKSKSATAMAALEEQAWLACWDENEDDEFGEEWRKAKFLQSIRIFHEDDDLGTRLRKIAGVVCKYTREAELEAADRLAGGTGGKLHNGELKLKFILKLKSVMSTKLMHQRERVRVEDLRQARGVERAVGGQSVAAVAKTKRLSMRSATQRVIKGVQLRDALKGVVDHATAKGGFRDVLRKHNLAVKRTKNGGRYNLPALFAGPAGGRTPSGSGAAAATTTGPSRSMAAAAAAATRRAKGSCQLPPLHQAGGSRSGATADPGADDHADADAELGALLLSSSMMREVAADAERRPRKWWHKLPLTRRQTTGCL